MGEIWRNLPIGAVVTEPGSSMQYKTGTWRVRRPVINKEKCVRCLFCWSYCPDAAIKIVENNYVEVNYDYCKGCGICASECPAKAIEMVMEEE